MTSTHEMTANQKRCVDYINARLEVLSFMAKNISNYINSQQIANEHFSTENINYNFMEGICEIQGAVNLFYKTYLSTISDLTECIENNNLEYWFIPENEKVGDNN